MIYQMHHHYSALRKKIFVTSKEDNLYLIHILSLLILLLYPIGIVYLNLPLSVFTVLMAAYILFSMLLPERLNFPLTIVGAVTIIYALYYLEEHYNYESHHYLIKSVLLFLFSSFMFYIMLREILLTTISLRLLYMCIDCYLFLGVTFTFLFRVIHFIDDGSFNFTIAEEFNHLYLSFIILTSVGMGDLLPLTLPAKAIVVIEGILGQIYMVFFASMIVGKYLASFKSN